MQSLHTPSQRSVTFDDDHAVANAGLALVGLLSEKMLFEDQTQWRPASRSAPLGRATQPEVTLREQMVTVRVVPRANRVGFVDHQGGNER